jgi:ketosteroid isomerase-like protein
MKADPKTEEEVLAALRQLVEAIRDKDVESTLGSFAEEEDVRFIGAEAGVFGRGREQLRTCFEELLAGPIGYGFRWDECDVSVSGDVAWLFAGGRLQTSSVAGHHEHPYRLTGVLRRVESKWLWMQIHVAEPVA